ncbi:bifunctional 3-(3-hydroxy-phenyl)propionate/3-hydroxycinnamic acid hydroxylase MhpA [Pseudaestuariivita sp.]|uniref:bifunctional 3-(3-hydroxy-phenyl)propionate/3-hydroxycinnamic acid hydroxylase MhpA n=1 Tax=Pseudaestuariivita sp. TaxID=2211669 RepID=UPI004059689F
MTAQNVAAAPPEQRQAEVAIVGAGPVGLMLAILLGRHGISVAIYDKWPEVYDRPRAVTMDAEVARILATLDIDVDLDPAFENHRELYYWKNAALEDLQIVDWESLAPCGWHVTYWFNQPQLEARLIEMAEALPNIHLARGWTATELEKDDTGVSLTLRDTATGQMSQTVTAQYLVGADGANSFVREALGLETIDKGYFFDWLILDMIPEPGFTVSPAQWQLCDPKRPTTIVPGGPGRRRWEFMVLQGESNAEISEPEAAWRLLEPWGLTPNNAELERSAVYRFQARWTKAWVAGRCMIAGDAAHLMPPFAGEGMCAGLRDAVALAWRLRGMLDGTLGPQVLQSYESERIAHAKHYIQFSQDLGDIICIADPQKAEARDARMKADLAARDFEPITGDLVKLGPGLWCAETPDAGALSPQGRVRFEGREDRFDQAVGQGWMLLGLDAPLGDLLTPDQSEAWERLGGRAFRIGSDAGPADVTALDDTYAEWRADGVAYVLIRPDFYVAATASTAGEMRGCLDRLLNDLLPAKI